MSRTKKSRKPSAFDINPIVEERNYSETPEPRRAKKTHGKKPGNRQQEAFQKKGTKGQVNNGKADPRLGSKKPIELTPNASKKPTVQTKPKVKAEKKAESAIAKIRIVEADDSLQNELYAIEDDERLQQILAKQEDDINLSEDEIDYFNEKMDRHQELSALLGLDEDEDKAISEQNQQKKSDDDEDMWDKLDSSDLSKFE